jgi:hypothetical protein
MIVHLRSRVARAARDDLVAFLATAKRFYEEPAGISVGLLWDVAETGRFIEVITYADRTTHDRDAERVDSDPVMGGYLQRWHQLLTEPVTVERYRDLSPLLSEEARS